MIQTSLFVVCLCFISVFANDQAVEYPVKNGDIQTEVGKLIRKVSALVKDVANSKKMVSYEFEKVHTEIKDLKEEMKRNNKLVYLKFVTANKKIIGLGEAVKQNQEITRGELSVVHKQITAILDRLTHTQPPITTLPTTTPTTLRTTALPPTTIEPRGLVYFPPGTKQHHVLKHYPEYGLTFTGFGRSKGYNKWWGSDDVSFDECLEKCTDLRKENPKDNLNSLTYEYDMRYCACYTMSVGMRENVHYLYYSFDE